jgi:hypothetical protein
VPRRIFGTKRDEIMGGWRKWHNEELHVLYSAPNRIRMTKSGRMFKEKEFGEYLYQIKFIGCLTLLGLVSHATLL